MRLLHIDHVNGPECPCGPMLSQAGEVVAHIDPAVPDDRALIVAFAFDESEPACYCGDPDPAGCMNLNAGYPFCRPCGEHHRPPECAIDQQGRALSPSGEPWEDVL